MSVSKSGTLKLKIGRNILKIKDCRGFDSIVGLMFNDMKDVDGALIYGNNIWMPFVKNNLDLFFLDAKYNLIETKKAIPLKLNPKTWKSYSNFNASYCLEIKSGLIKKLSGKIRFTH